MNLVLNDLSISDIIKLDEQVSSQIVEKFVICFRELVKSKFPFSRTLDTVIDLNNIMLSPTMPMLGGETILTEKRKELSYQCVIARMF